MAICDDDKAEVYNKGQAGDNATKKIISYLINNAPNFWKLLRYTSPTDKPYELPDLDLPTKRSMIAKDLYATNENVDKNVLFMTEIDEAFSNAIPQVRIEVGQTYPLNYTQWAMIINFQIVVPKKQNLFDAPYSDVADRSYAIFRELLIALNGKKIPETLFNSPMFMNMVSSGAVGKRTGQSPITPNKAYKGRIATFAVLI